MAGLMKVWVRSSLVWDKRVWVVVTNVKPPAMRLRLKVVVAQVRHNNVSLAILIGIERIDYENTI